MLSVNRAFRDISTVVTKLFTKMTFVHFVFVWGLLVFWICHYICAPSSLALQSNPSSLWRRGPEQEVGGQRVSLPHSSGSSPMGLGSASCFSRWTWRMGSQHHSDLAYHLSMMSKAGTGAATAERASPPHWSRRSACLPRAQGWVTLALDLVAHLWRTGGLEPIIWETLL